MRIAIERHRLAGQVDGDRRAEARVIEHVELAGALAGTGAGEVAQQRPAGFQFVGVVTGTASQVADLVCDHRRTAVLRLNTAVAVRYRFAHGDLAVGADFEQQVDGYGGEIEVHVRICPGAGRCLDLEVPGPGVCRSEAEAVVALPD